MTDFANRERLIAEAESYQACGEALPLDLYSALLEEGINASLYNTNSPDESENEDEQ